MSQYSWVQIYEDYVSDETMSYQKLSDKYGVNLTTIKERGASEDWQGKRAKVLLKAYQLAEKRAITKVAAFREKQIRVGQLLAGKGLEAMVEKDIEPKTSKEAREYVMDGMKLEGEGLGVNKPEMASGVNNLQQNIQLVWGNGKPVPPYRPQILSAQPDSKN